MSMSSEAQVNRILNSLGWEWYEDGVVLTANVSGDAVRVLVPLRVLSVTFGRELALPGAIGCVGCADLVQSIGAAARSIDYEPQEIGLSRTQRRARRKVRSKRRRRKRRKFFRGIKRAAGGVVKAAKKVAKGVLKIATSKVAQGLVAALGTAVPVLAPAAGAVATAQGVVRKIAAGVDAAQQIKRGKRSPQLERAVRAGLAANQIVRDQATRARAGDRNAQQFAGGIAVVAAGRA